MRWILLVALLSWAATALGDLPDLDGTPEERAAWINAHSKRREAEKNRSAAAALSMARSSEAEQRTYVIAGAILGGAVIISIGVALSKRKPSVDSH